MNATKIPTDYYVNYQIECDKAKKFPYQVHNTTSTDQRHANKFCNNENKMLAYLKALGFFFFLILFQRP